MQIMTRITTLRTLYVHVVLNSVICPQTLYDIVLYTRHFLLVLSSFSIISLKREWVRLAKSDKATVVRRSSKRRSKHALNSIKLCKLQNNWFKFDGLGNRHKVAYSPICQTLFSTWRPCVVQRQFRGRAGNVFSPPEAVLLLVLTKSSAAPGGC